MRSVLVVLACATVISTNATPAATGNVSGGSNGVPLALAAARVSLEGTSSLHPYTASTTAVRIMAMEIGGSPAGELLEHVLQPGGLKTFEIVIPAASLSSPKEGIDKNMHKALQVETHPDIRFRLRELEPADGSYRATGWLTIAGVERPIVLSLQIARTGSALAVTGSTELLMTDFGIKPPKAMLGMIRTDPKVQVRIELTLGASLT